MGASEAARTIRTTEIGRWGTRTCPKSDAGSARSNFSLGVIRAPGRGLTMDSTVDLTVNSRLAILTASSCFGRACDHDRPPSHEHHHISDALLGSNNKAGKGKSGFGGGIQCMYGCFFRT